MSHEIIAALLEADEDDDAGLGKELTEPSDDFLAQQAAKLLPQAIQRKEEYLNKPCIKTVQSTNPKGETFIFGKFGKRNGVMATLLYLSPMHGWKLTEDVDDEDDFKEVYGEPPVAPKYLPLGSISSATMREEHLIPAFLRALRWVDPAKAAQLSAEYETLPEEEHADFCWETLFSALEEHAPPYTYFGSHPGDGADYGVWVSDESLDDELRYQNEDELRAIKQGEPVVPGTGYIVVTDAAGNYIALLDGTNGREIWNIE